MEARVMASRIVVSWETAKTRASKATELEQEREMRSEPKMILASDFQSMRKPLEVGR